ncbi:MAG: tRNA 4-thiouridine(8) synthase ThiI [Lachnospiraceae bacterium]|nr:tRNA 4-thiouridine(8) synthase ThiI [Lachnospiraceae bacterium]
MNRTFLIKYAEIAIKGKNRRIFEDALVRNIRSVLQSVEGNYIVRKENGRIYVKAEGEADLSGAEKALSRVFGIKAYCPVTLLPDEGFERLSEEVVRLVGETWGKENVTFKVDARRARKNYPLDSMEINAALGEALLTAYPNLRVDVHTPEKLLRVEIREEIAVYSEELPGPGGLPVGTSGNACLLLSGGIDSPVAGYLISKRGVKLSAVYFHAPPYTSERAKQKVVDLAKLISLYAGEIRLHIVNFTDVQLKIYDECPHDELTIIMRRYMMEIAEHFAVEDGCQALITGESIGQVASQTMQSLFCTDEAATLPVFRPLIGFDKQDIIDISERIGTYETSILPFEDCCTIFVAKHPVTKPRLDRIKKSEELLTGKIEELVETAIAGTETMTVTP